MTKLKQIFNNIVQKAQELDNAEKLKTMLPISVIYDMQYNFARQDNRPKHYSSFDSYLTSEDDNWSTEYQYKSFNPQNQVILHGMAYKKLLDIYKKYSSIDMQRHFTDYVIGTEEYNKMPKRYRSVFRPYLQGKYYILRKNYDSMVISVAKNNRSKFINLLKTAENLIPLIYKEKQIIPNLDFGGFQIFEDNNIPQEEPLFVKDSLSASKVSNEQMQIIKSLHDIFVELSKITFPYPVEFRETRNENNAKKLSGALNIWREYQNELQRKGTYLESRKELQPIIDEYKQQHDIIIAKLKDKILSFTR